MHARNVIATVLQKSFYVEMLSVHLVHVCRAHFYNSSFILLLTYLTFKLPFSIT